MEAVTGRAMGPWTRELKWSGKAVLWACHRAAGTQQVVCRDEAQLRIRVAQEPYTAPLTVSAGSGKGSQGACSIH